LLSAATFFQVGAVLACGRALRQAAAARLAVWSKSGMRRVVVGERQLLASPDARPQSVACWVDRRKHVGVDGLVSQIGYS